MKKIDFETLSNLVANIDYIYDKSFPVRFAVDGVKYECGIIWEDEDQYLIQRFYQKQNYKMLHRKDPDMMSYEEICKLLKRKCHIKKNSVIELDKRYSFKGKYLMI